METITVIGKSPIGKAAHHGKSEDVELAEMTLHVASKMGVSSDDIIKFGFEDSNQAQGLGDDEALKVVAKAFGNSDEDLTNFGSITSDEGLSATDQEKINWLTGQV